MLLRQLISPTLLFPILVVSAAPSAEELITTNQILQSSTENANTDVNNPLESIPEEQVPKDLQDLAANITTTQAFFASIAKVTNTGTEQDIVNSYGPFADALTTLSQSLINQKALYIPFQGTAISGDLQNLERAFEDFGQFLQGILAGATYAAAISESSEGAVSGLANAIAEY